VVHVVIKDRVVAALGRGEPFGEIAFATGQPRTADLVAASPGTELLQLSPGALKSLSPGARATLWKNLAWCLGKRLTDTTAMLT
jgi:CRP-like cAMP-binding protein